MCGIAGILGTEWSEKSLTQATEYLTHRGPDDSGIEIIQTGKGRLGLGHRRLSILDLSSAGHQPMHDPNNGNIIVYNGEIYNHLEIREKLDGRRFRSSCDTETLLIAYDRWGEKALDYFVGMFAFALWDQQRQELLLVRDRLGIKPLYFTENPKYFSFASELKALLAGRLITNRIDAEALESYLSFGAVQEPQSILKDARLLNPGHLMRVGPDGRVIKLIKYWSLSDFFCQKRDTSYIPHQDEINQAVNIAVRDRLISDVPIGAFLSGGIDSSVIVAKMAIFNDVKPHTYCLDFPEGKYREGRYAEQVSKWIGTKHKTTLVRSDELLRNIDDAFPFMDQPTSDGINSFFISGVAQRSGVTVVLSGQGGDEVFAGYPSFRLIPDALRLKGMPRFLRTPASLLFSITPNLNLRWRKVQDLLACKNIDIYAAYAHLRGIFWDRRRKDILCDASRVLASEWVRATIGENELSSSVINQISQLEIACYLRNTLLRDLDCFSMAHSIEVRVPLLDHRLVEVLASIDGALKVSRNVNKPLLVNTVTDQLPLDFFKRPKGIFWFPWEAWLRGKLGKKIESYFTSSYVLHDQVGLKSDKVKEIWQKFQQRAPDVSWNQIWTIFVLLRWASENDASL